MPPSIHADAEALPWITRLLAGDDEIWVAEVDETVVAYLRLTPDLARRPVRRARACWHRHRRRSCSTSPSRCDPEGFGLWVFEVNTPARAFYARHGLVEVERTDGSANEEQEPDIRMTWTPT